MPKFTIPDLCEEAQKVIEKSPRVVLTVPYPFTREIMYQKMAASKHLLRNVPKDNNNDEKK